MMWSIAEYYASEDRWDTLAAKLGNVVLDLAPRWLVVVEGVGHCMDSAGAQISCLDYQLSLVHRMMYQSYDGVLTVVLIGTSYDALTALTT